MNLMKRRSPKINRPPTTRPAFRASASWDSEPQCRCGMCSYRGALQVLRQR